MMFRIGMKVVCIDATPRKIPVAVLQKGAIYTIVALPYCPDGEHGVELAEVESQAIFGFWKDRFRPLVERKTSIEIFQRMLTPSHQKESAR